jgi:hypothetical protein
MAPKQAVKKTKSVDGWQVQVVGYNDLSIAPNGDASGEATRVPLDTLLATMMDFAGAAGSKLNTLDVCPSEFTIEGHVSLDVGGGVLLFGVSAGISVSMTWKFEEEWTATTPRGGKRGLTPDPDDD